MSIGEGLYENPVPGYLLGVPTSGLRAQFAIPSAIGIPTLSGANTWSATQTIDLGTGTLPTLSLATQLQLAASDSQSVRIQSYAYASNPFNLILKPSGGTRSTRLYPTSGLSVYQVGLFPYDEATGDYTASAMARALCATTELHTATAKGLKWSFTAANRGSASAANQLDLIDQRLMHMGDGASAPTANTFSGNVFFGCNNGTSALTGQVGELVESKISTSQNAATTANYLALTSITLTAGEWDISAIAEPRAAGATFAVGGQTVVAVGTTSASASGTTSGYSNALATYQTTTTVPGPLILPRIAVSITTSTTYYLNVYAEYSAGTPQWRGSISARRIR